MRTPRIKNLCSWILVIGYWTLNIFPVSAAGLTLTPSFQEVSVIATESSNPFIATQSQQKESTAFVTYHNQSDSPLTLNFSLTSITATDLYGRFQFNAPLPQTIRDINSAPTGTRINTKSLSLKPDEIATASVTFSPNQLRPGTNAFLLLANFESLVASLSASPNSSRESLTSISQSLGSSILVNAYGGSTVDLKLTKLEWSPFPIRFSLPDYLTLTLNNQGNLRAIPRGVVRNIDIFGREVGRGALNEASTVILPGSQRVVYATLSPVKPMWPLMRIHLQISGYNDDHQSQFSLTKSFLYINPWLLPGTILVIGLCIVIKRKIYKLRFISSR